MTRRRSSPLGLEIIVSFLLALVAFASLSHGAPAQDAHAHLQKNSDGCYYNYNHYSEGDRILTNEPCLNCTCHNKMLMCYLRVCPFTKAIGHDCTVEKREDQCCPIITCPEVIVDVSHHVDHLTTNAPGTELSTPDKYGCNIDSKFYPEGVLLPSNSNKPCELCYCIQNRTSCLLQECTLHIDGCQPIYNKGSCCPVRYNCDRENELLEIEDLTTTTTTVRPTSGYVLASTSSPTVSTDCVHNNEVFADGTSITGKNACEHCYCMRGDIVCAVQECETPTLESGTKTCRSLPPASGNCCPSNYVCDDVIQQTEASLITSGSNLQIGLHESVSQEDVQLQEHIDDKVESTNVPENTAERHDANQITENVTVLENGTEATAAPVVGDVAESNLEEYYKKSQNESESLIVTTISTIKEKSEQKTPLQIEANTMHKIEQELDYIHIIDQDKEYVVTQAPIEDKIIIEAIEGSTAAPFIIDIKMHEVIPNEFDAEEGEKESSTSMAKSAEEEEKDENFTITTTASVEFSKSSEEESSDDPTKKAEEQSEVDIKAPAREHSLKPEKPLTTDFSAPSKAGINPQVEYTPTESFVPSKQTSIGQLDTEHKYSIISPVYETIVQGTESVISMPEIGDHKFDTTYHTKKEDEEAERSTNVPVASVTGDIKKAEFSQVTVGTTTISKEVSDLEETTWKPVTIDPEITEINAAQTSERESLGYEETSSESSDPSITTTNKPLMVNVEQVTLGGVGSEETQTLADNENKTPAIEVLISKVEEGQTTVLPIKGSVNKSEAEESQEEQTYSEEDIIVEKVTTNIPNRVSINEENKQTGIHKTDIENSVKRQDNDSLTTMASSATSEEAKRQPEKGLFEATSIASSAQEEVTDVQAPIDNNRIRPEQNPQVTQEKSDKLFITGTPSTIGHFQPNSGSTETLGFQKDEIKEQSLTGATTSPQFIVDSEEPVSGEEEIKVNPKEDLSKLTTSTSSVFESEKIVLETEIQKQPEHVLSDATTVAWEPKPDENEIKQKDITFESSTQLIASSDQSISEIGKPKERPSEDGTDFTTTAQSIFGLVKPSSGDEKIKEQAHEYIAHTIIPSLPVAGSTTITSVNTDPEASNSQEDTTPNPPVDTTPNFPSLFQTEKPISTDKTVGQQPGTSFIELSTIASYIDDFKISSFGGKGDKVQPSEEILDSSSSASLIPESETPEGETDHGISLSSVLDSDGLGSDEDSVDFPTIAISIADSKQPIAVEDETKKDPEKSIVDIVAFTQSGEESKTEPDEGIIEPSTVFPLVDEENTINTKESIFEPSTSVASVVTKDKMKDDSQHHLHDGMTVISHAESEVEKNTKPGESFYTSLLLEENTKIKPEQGVSESFSPAPSTLNPEGKPGREEEIIKLQLEQDILDQITIAPVKSESEKPIQEVYDYKQQTEQEDIPHTTVSRILSPNEESSEVVEAGVGSGEKPNDIIPSAIPGEGDCLFNDKTFANNASVPTSNECEISCTCVSSIVVCRKAQCDEIPQPNNCVSDEESSSPQYNCGANTFSEDQQPTAPELIENDKFQFTTSPPIKKYSEKEEPPKPVLEAEFEQVETSEKEKPIKSLQSEIEVVDLPVKKPILSIEITTIQEESTNLSASADPKNEKDMSVKITPEETFAEIQSKPPKQGQETPVETPSVIGDFTTLKVVEEDIKNFVTDAPIHVPAGNDYVNYSTSKLTVIESEASTESSINLGASKITPILESSIINLNEAEVKSEAPSLNLVFGPEGIDSEKQIPTLSNPSLSGKGEESPQHAEDDNATTFETTHKDFAAYESTTTISVEDYQKPEMPEDKKNPGDSPVEPLAPKDSFEFQEKEPEHIGQSNTILTLVKPTETVPEVMDRKEMSTESGFSTEEKSSDQSTEQDPVDAGNSVYSKITTPTSEEEIIPGYETSTQDQETFSKGEKDKQFSHTSTSLSKGDPTSENNEILIQTSAPVAEQPLSIMPITKVKPTVSPMQELSGAAASFKQDKDEMSYQTDAPTTTPQALFSDVLFGTTFSSEEDDQETDFGTLKPNADKNYIEKKQQTGIVTSKEGDNSNTISESAQEATDPSEITDEGLDSIEATSTSTFTGSIKDVFAHVGETHLVNIDLTETSKITSSVKAEEFRDEDLALTDSSTNLVPIKSTETSDAEMDYTEKSKITDEDLKTTEAPAISTPVNLVESSNEEIGLTHAPAIILPIKVIKSDEEGLISTDASLVPVKTIETSVESLSSTEAGFAPVKSQQGLATVEISAGSSSKTEDVTETLINEVQGDLSQESSTITSLILNSDAASISIAANQVSDREGYTPAPTSIVLVSPSKADHDSIGDLEIFTEDSLVDKIFLLTETSVEADKLAPSEGEISIPTEPHISSNDEKVDVDVFDKVLASPVKPDSNDQVSLEGISSDGRLKSPTEASVTEEVSTTDGKKPSLAEPTKTSETSGIVPNTDEQTSEQTVTRTKSPVANAMENKEFAIQRVEPVWNNQEQTTASGTEGASKEKTSGEQYKDEMLITVSPTISFSAIIPIASEGATSLKAPEGDQTESSQYDTEIHTVTDFVTEYGNDATTILPIQDSKKEKRPIATSPDETTMSSFEGKEELKPQLTIAVEKTDEKTPDNGKPNEHQTESKSEFFISEKPVEAVNDRLDTDLSRPIVIDKSVSEFEITTSRLHLNASDKIENEVYISEATGSSPPIELSPTTPQPITSAPTSHYQPPSYGHFPPQYPSYTEDEYTDEDETEVFGPGTCRYGGKLFVSAQQIPRDDPCDFCFCFRSDIICLQQSCPPPISGCHEEPISGFCCPRYECPVSMATVLNITTSTTTTSTTLPPHFLHHAYQGAAEKTGCHIGGKSFNVGDKIDSASGPCMRCTCGGDGQMKCDPKTCLPEPMLRQMIAVVASRRR